MSNLKIKFVNIDSWNRPIYKDEHNNYYGSTDKLFPYEESENTVNSYFKDDPNFHLCYFGNHFDCEPMGTPINKNTVLEIVQ